MIIGTKRKQVINNIKNNLVHQRLNAKAELHDPVLNKEQSQKIIEKFWQNKQKLSHQFLNKIINSLLAIITPLLTKHDQICENDSLKYLSSAFISCNHYNQLDILPINKLARKYHRRLYFIVEDNNLMMYFPINLLVRNADSIPITNSPQYLGRILPLHLKKIFAKSNWILIYPEQELWFNYRKPRPLQHGVYYYAAKLQIPIISCFAEIQERPQTEWFHRDFHKTKIVLHVLPVIKSDPKLSIRENELRMCKLDYQQKVAAYEKAYHRKLTYHFEDEDIAGLKK